MDNIIISLLIAIGALLMAFNIIFYVVFLQKMRDVISSGRREDHYFLLG